MVYEKHFKELKNLYSEEQVKLGFIDNKYLFTHDIDFKYFIGKKSYDDSKFLNFIIFKVLNNLKNTPNIEDIFLRETILFDVDKSFICDILVNEDYIKPISVENSLSPISFEELSRLLVCKGIESSYKKRLEQFVVDDLYLSNIPFANYGLTPKAKTYLDDYGWMEIYESCLEKFEFDDYYYYLLNHKDSDVILNTIEYISIHMDEAHRIREFDYLTDSYLSLSQLYVLIGDYESALDVCLEHLIIRLNPLYNFKQYYLLYDVFDEKLIGNIEMLSKLCDVDFEKLFYKKWDLLNLNHEYVSKSEACIYLKKALENSRILGDLSAFYCRNYLDFYFAQGFSRNDEVIQKLIKTVSEFCIQNFNNLFKNQAIQMIFNIQRLDLDFFDDGKVESWASGIIYCLSRDNSFFNTDASFFMNVDTISNYFNTKPSEISKIVFKIDTLLKPDDDNVYIHSIYEFTNYGYLNFDIYDWDVNSKDYKKYYNLAMLSYNDGMYGDAISYFDKSLKLKPNQEEVLFQKSLACYNIGYYLQAIGCIDEAIELNPHNPNLFNAKAIFLIALNKFDSAHDTFEKAIDLASDNEIIWFNKGYLYYEECNFEEAIKCYDMALKNYAYFEKALLYKADSHSFMCEWGDVEECFFMFEKFDPLNAKLLLSKANYHILRREFEIAIKFCGQYLNMDNRSTDALFLMATCYTNLGELDKSNECMLKIGEIDPFTFEFLRF